MWMTGTLPLQSRNDLGNILQKAPCTHRDVVYTGDMNLFSKKKVVYELTHTETMRFNNSGMFDRQERNPSDYVWDVIKNPNSVSYSTWGDL